MRFTDSFLGLPDCNNREIGIATMLFQ